MLSHNTPLLFATENAGKRAELEKLFSDSGIPFATPHALAGIPEVEETGNSYSENAIIKARAYALHYGLPSLGDDSGLEVAALRGRPGVLSARYGGASLTYDEKIRLLLDEMEKADEPDRSARFVCVMAMAGPDGSVLVCEEGICHGSIIAAPRGRNGFGYDPIFMPNGFDLTFGQLDDQVKNSISHRALAAAKIIRYLLGFIAV